MLFSLVFKEWLKLRMFFVALLLLNFSICVKIFFDIRQQMYSEHAEMVWYQLIHIHTVPYTAIMYLPLMTGFILASAQFVPEMLGRRMRISLHLPTGRNCMLVAFLFTGLFLYLAVCCMDCVVIFVVLRTYFPVEVAWSSIPTIAPWIIAGLLSYCGTMTVLLEIAWPRRIFLFVVFSTLCLMLFGGTGYGWFTPALWYVIGLLPLVLLSVFESGRRFQQRGTQ